MSNGCDVCDRLLSHSSHVLFSTAAARFVTRWLQAERRPERVSDGLVITHRGERRRKGLVSEEREGEKPALVHVALDLQGGGQPWGPVTIGTGRLPSIAAALMCARALVAGGLAGRRCVAIVEGSPRRPADGGGGGGADVEQRFLVGAAPRCTARSGARGWVFPQAQWRLPKAVGQSLRETMSPSAAAGVPGDLAQGHRLFRGP